MRLANTAVRYGDITISLVSGRRDAKSCPPSALASLRIPVAFGRLPARRHACLGTSCLVILGNRFEPLPRHRGEWYSALHAPLWVPDQGSSGGVPGPVSLPQGWVGSHEPGQCLVCRLSRPPSWFLRV